MVTPKRDSKGRYYSDSPKRYIMRVTKQEKEIIERFRKIKPSKLNLTDLFTKELRDAVRMRVNNIET